ncbi:alkaline phosphatase family protein [bacterium]|nr:alkaline phosphatase family protein [bacterium]RQV93777.1 MAG: peptidase [bacterium]
MIKILLIFVDGLGLGSDDPLRNPCVQDHLNIFDCYENGDGIHSAGRGGFLLPTDATLGVDGLPQSGTGQSTLLTGINCSKLLGRHLQGYPNSRLRDILRQYSLLKQVKEMGCRPAFINAYRPLFFALNKKIQWCLSTTTVATLSADIPFFQIDDIRKKRSIYHDFTNESLIKRGFNVDLFSPEEAAHILVQASKQYDFVLYEYFMTDRAGHSQEMERCQKEIKKLDRFMTSLLSELDLNANLVILTSDHGNIEDLSVKTHTRNKVMTLLWGRGSESVVSHIRTLEDITPAVLRLFAVYI